MKPALNCPQVHVFNLNLKWLPSFAISVSVFIDILPSATHHVVHVHVPNGKCTCTHGLIEVLM